MIKLCNQTIHGNWIIKIQFNRLQQTTPDFVGSYKKISFFSEKPKKSLENRCSFFDNSDNK